MALAHRTSSGHTASPSSTASTSTAAAATMIASSPAPPSPVGPPRPVGPWGPNSICRTCLSDFAAVLVVLVCFSCVGLCIHYAARVLLRCLDRRAAREAAQAQEPKPPSDADDADGASPVAAGVWAEAECAICLAELDDLEGGGERVRVRVLPACGHGFHAACVEAWLATRASCPTCRAPSSSRSRPPSRTTRAP
ncbi:RING-H2 finger protein ATL79-like [Miscanthus floridulus]|uniref:RING-H2 finger protein ATL79-like n=1 Tax=Miscanthus floridulus TaxID=154761 RepID=UPI003459B8CC